MYLIMMRIPFADTYNAVPLIITHPIFNAPHLINIHFTEMILIIYYILLLLRVVLLSFYFYYYYCPTTMGKVVMDDVILVIY